MARLRRADCSGPGFRRVRRGRGLHLPRRGRRADRRARGRRAASRELGIPPAWKDVWICPWADGPHPGHGRRRGRPQAVPLPPGMAHPARRARSSTRCSTSPRTCPRCATASTDELAAGDELTRERVLACAVRLLDRGFFRIGTEEYAESNESFGLATMRKEHVKLEDGDTMVFDYPAKSGKRQIRAVVDPRRDRRRRRSSSAAAAAATSCSPSRTAAAGPTSARATSTSTSRRSPARATPPRTSGPGTRPCWRRSRWPSPARWRTPRPAASARSRARSRRSPHYLGNTPAVCRASYIDPRVFDAYKGGLIIRPALGGGRRGRRRARRAIHQPALEKAVLDLIDERASAPGIEKIAAWQRGLSTLALEPAVQRAGGDAVEDHREDHGGDRGPGDQLRLGARERAEPASRRRRRRASRRRGRRTRRGTRARPGAGAASRAARG